MGTGIAQVSASAGFTTILYELNEDVLRSARMRMEQDLQQLVAKEKITNEKKEAIFQQLRFTSDIHQCIADVVIEAIIERPETKLELFRQLTEVNALETVFATNTSSLSVSELAKGVVAPQRFAGLHFFNPAPLMKLVEVVRGEQTSSEAVDILTELAKKFGKEPVVCKDAPGFVVNRVARPYYIEALRLAEEGVASFATIDRLMESKGFKMGPFKLMDLIGNDVNYAVSCSVYEQLGRPQRLKPSPIQKEKVDKGELGRKTRKGYFDY
jgi:3-hydroxybutyryl-CoA dehydrogenase